MADLDLQPVARNLRFPEGPVAMADGSLLFVQIEGQELSRLTTHNKVETVVKLPGGPNGLAIGPDGAAYVCNNGGVFSFVKLPTDGDTGHAPGGGVTIPDPGGPPPGFTGGQIQRIALAKGAPDRHHPTVLYDNFEGAPLISPDDIVFDATGGGFYFTASGAQYRDRIVKGGVYYGTIHGDPLKFVAAIPTANGIGLSRDGTTLYVADTIFARLWALDIASPGVVRMPPPGIPDMPGKVVMTLPGYQMVDSLKVEAGGNVCVGTISLGGGGITVYHPDGTPPRRIPVPDPFVTNLCFGVADPRDVWITASGTGVIYKARWDRPGLPLAYTA